jgi:hypothetical protein
MLFRSIDQNGLLPASWTDVELAGAQGTITGVKLVNDHIQGSDKPNWLPIMTSSNNDIEFGKSLKDRENDNVRLIISWLFLLMSTVIFCFFLYRYCVTLEDYTSSQTKDERMAMQRSLVDKTATNDETDEGEASTILYSVPHSAKKASSGVVA